MRVGIIVFCSLFVLNANAKEFNFHYFPQRPVGKFLYSPSGIPLVTAPGDQLLPSIASDGENYFAIWEDSRANPIRAIYGALINGQGVLLCQDIVLSNPAFQFDRNKVLSNGQKYLAIWGEINPQKIAGTLIAKNGTVIRKHIEIKQGNGDYFSPTGTVLSSEFIIIWVEYADGFYSLHGTRMNGEGLLTGEQTLLPPRREPIRSVQIATNGNTFLVVWDQNDGNLGGALFSADLSPLNTSLILTNQIRNRDPNVVWGGKHYLVVWESDRREESDIYGVRVTPDGQVIDLENLPISIAEGPQSQPQIVWANNTYMVIWRDDRNRKDSTEPGTESHIFGTQVSADGSVEGDFPITEKIPHTISYSYDYPAISWNGSKFMLAWTTNNADKPNGLDISAIVASHLGRSKKGNLTVEKKGTKLPRQAVFAITRGNGEQFFPAVASDGMEFLVVYKDNRHPQGGLHEDIYGTTVDDWGRVKDPWIPIATNKGGQDAPVIRGNDNRYLAAWIDKDANALKGALMNRKGVILKPVDLVTGRTVYSFDITQVGNRFVVIWFERDGELMTASVDNEGNVIQLPPLLVPAMTRSNGIRIATQGRSLLVVWESSRKIFGLLLSSAFEVKKDSFVISNNDNMALHPAVAGGKNGFLVAWQQSSDVTSVAGKLLSENGEASQSFIIATGTYNEIYHDFPDVIWTQSNYLVTWATFTYGFDSRDKESTYIFAAHVLPGGPTDAGVLVTNAFNVSGQSPLTQKLENNHPRASFSGSQALIVWQGLADRRNEYNIFGFLYRPDKKVWRINVPY
ncbi:MAG: hypothetical protein HY537_04945 [Deltaproteobacteria bacterium]|nr:hypothetical protein [Deltaproteobacteria bacterium]